MAIRCQQRLTCRCCGSVLPSGISAIVDMNHPGVFVLGDLSDDDRRHGMGMAMEQRPPRIIGDEVKSDLLEAALMVVLVKERPAPVTAKARIDLSFRQFPLGAIGDTFWPLRCSGWAIPAIRFSFCKPNSSAPRSRRPS